jgi:hypothetical protein
MGHFTQQEAVVHFAAKAARAAAKSFPWGH